MKKWNRAGWFMLPIALAFALEAGAADAGAQGVQALGMKAEPQTMNQSEIFHRPTVVFKNREKQAAEKAKVEAEKFLYPSPAFLVQYSPWRLRLGNVALLHDNVMSLFQKHPDCRRISSTWERGTGRVACRNTRDFLAEGDEVIFTYAKQNEILTSAAFFFNSQQRAEQFAGNVEQMLARGVPTYRQSFENGSLAIDSPMFSVDVHEASKGFMVNIDAYFQDRITDSEIYAREKLQTIDFGDLTIGKSLLTDLPNKEDLPKVCNEVTSTSDPNVKEYYGVCFGFPYEAHMQFNFSPATGILETAVLSPIGTATGSVVEDWLTKKYGLPQYCRRLTSDVTLYDIKDKPRRGRPRFTRMKGRTASLFAGTCENPVIFSTEMRYIFENRYLRTEEIMHAYERRKDLATASAEHSEAFGERGKAVKGFFE